MKRLSKKDEENLANLREIERYLNQTIDEHQRILNSHFDLKEVYTRELEALSQMSLIRRFSLRAELYDKVLESPSALKELDFFLRPLFNQDAGKIYNINKAFELQKPVRRKEEKDSMEEIDFDEEQWQIEQDRIRKERLRKYEECLNYLIEMADRQGEISLQGLKEQAEQDRLIPNVEIFREIMVELIKNQVIDIPTLQKERSEFIQDMPVEFQLNEMVLHLIEEKPGLDGIRRIETYRQEDQNTVIFEHVQNEKGERKSIRCSDVLIRIIREG